MTFVPLLRLLRPLVWALGLALAATCATAGTTTIGVGVDTDNNTATGCVVSTANGPVAGIDRLFSTVVTTTANGATVTHLQQQVCVGGVFGSPSVYDPGGWNVGLGKGMSASAVVESSIPLSLLPLTGTMRAVVVTNDGSGGQDATATFAIALSPSVGPTGLGTPITVPLAPWLVPLLALLLFATTLWLRRRYPGQTGLLLVFAVFTMSGLVWAATVVRDGNIGDWNGVAPAVTDALGDAPVNADVVAVFYQQDSANLYLRFDVDIHKDAPGNQAPQVNAGANQTITLPSGATLIGTATDDGLPNPPATLTYAWTKFSGPGTVTFGNANAGATTATFGVAGTYALRLTVGDSALSGSADVTIVVNQSGTTNQPPVVSAGTNQTITLPAAATLAGTANDDGLPNPPGVLATSWSMVSGPASGVVFANASAPATTATFAAPGTYVLRLLADDGSMTASSTVQITVIDGAPLLAAIADRTIELGNRLQVLLEARDGNANDTLTYALTAAPTGATLNPAPLIDWTPTAAQLGTNTFTAKVTDSSGKAATRTFNVTVVHTNHAPQLGPQASLTMPVGNAFARTLTASDPDVGDVLTFSLLSGPPGMTLIGANLNWSTSGLNAGDYLVTVKVSGPGGLSDQKTFTITLSQAAPGPIAKDDSYTIKVADTLTVPASGVLANDIYSGKNALTAMRLSDTSVGAVTAFGADGSFTYQAPATVPGVPLTMAREWNTSSGGSDRYHELVADLNGDGYPDVVSFDNNGGIRARSGLNGNQLWAVDRTGAEDCVLNTGNGSMDSRVLADLDDSGHPTLAFATFCGREGSLSYDNLVAFDHTGHVKWVSPPLSKPHPDIAHGATPPPPGGFTPGGVATFSGLSAARLTAGGPPVLLLRQEISHDWGYSLYYDANNQGHYAGCRAVTGLPADENVACRATLIISGVDGSVLQTLVVRNPAAVANFGGPSSLQLMPPIAMDIDGDGRVDLVSGTEVWMQNASGGFDLAWQLTNSVNDTAVADLDGDGKAEIIHIRNSASLEDLRGIFIYSFDGKLQRRIPLQTYWFTPLTIADVDGDGRSDIVLGGDGTLYAFRDDGRPIWAYQVPQEQPDNPVFAPYFVQQPQSFSISNAAPQVYDLDGDGVAEVVIAAYGRIMVLDGRTGLRKLNPFWTYNWSYNDISALMLIDVNNDGHVDIVQNAAFVFNCDFVGADFATQCYNLVGPIALSGGGTNNWLPGPKAFPHVQYRSTAIDSHSRVLHDTKVSRIFRVPEQQGTVRDPRFAQATSFTYSASDGATSSAAANVFIHIVPDNRPPVFTSVPPTSVLQSSNPSFYDVTAIDPDPGDTITFSLKQAPNWVTMSGPARISFAPTTPWGLTTVIVTATDSFGASTDQIFIVNLTNIAATVPNVTGMQFEAAKTTLIANDLQGVKWVEEFSAQPVGIVLAQDPVAGTIVGRLGDIHLTVSKGSQPVTMPFVVGMQLAPANSILVAAGLTVNVSTAFSNTIPAGEVMAQSPAANTLLLPATAPPVDLTVSAGGPLSAPIASIVLQPGPGPFARLAGEDQQFKAIAILTDGTSADVTVTAAWSTTNAAAATVNVAGFAHAKASGVATITASLSGKSGSVTLNVSPLVPGDVTAPTALITSPADGADVTGPVPIVGTASDANFLRYELAISLAGDENYTTIAEGTTAVTNGTLGTFDPTTLLNDLYTLRLTVFDKGQNESVGTSTVQLKGNRKIGLFTLTYQDLNVPAAGIPLTINRTYDSRDKAKGDFGIGWRLGLRTLRLRTNRVLGTGWIRTVSGPVVSLAPTSEHKVSVTLPDGRVEEFDMIVSPTSNIGSLDFTNVTGFQPRPGTLGKLQSLVNNSLLIVNGGAEDELVDDATLNTYSPTLYRYTTAEGTLIEISPAEGVKKVTDSNGNAVTFGPGGILHSNGTGIAFTRDAKDRIVAITDVLGNVQTYAYDRNGDLLTHTNPVGGVSTYAYDGSHGIIEVRDATGNRAVRNEYDASGRLIAMIDANGNRVEFTHNPGAQEELVTDRRGSVNRLTYDSQGNVLVSERAVTIEGVLVNAVRTMTYDAQGNVTSRVDPDGLKTGATYSGVLPLTQVTDPGGLNLTTSLTYNTRNDPTTATDPGGRAFTFAYDANGNLTGATTPLAGSSSSTSNANGQPAQNLDALGNKRALTYDARGNVTREDTVDAAANLLRRTDFTYDANGKKTSATLYRTIGAVLTPLTTQFTYDAANRLTSVTDPVGGITRTEYDASGRVTASVDALGRRTSMSFDSLGRIEKTAYPDGTFAAVTYDENGNVASETDAAGRTTTFAYDELNRKVKTTRPGGAVEQTIYSAGGRVDATVDARGNRTDYTYDAAGRPISTTLPAVQNGVAGPIVRPRFARTLNTLGLPSTATDSLGRTTVHTYDAAGRAVQTTFADGTNVKQTFDALGRRSSAVNEEGQTTTFAYDGLGRVVSVSGLAGEATYSYDEAGNLLVQTDALGRATRFRYDTLNRPIEKQYPGGEIETSVYDAVGNLVALTDANGKSITFVYDAMNRVVRKNLPGGTGVVYVYAADGKRSTVTDGRGTTTYTYDAQGQLAGVAHPGGETVGYNRDANGNLLAVASPAATVNYGYDALNRLIQVTAPEGQAQQYYDLVGNRVRETAANGIVSDAIFDARNRPTQLAHMGAGNAVLQSYASVYSPAGRRTQITEHDGSVETYVYDAKGRLASEVRVGNHPFSDSHSYDAVGNRVQRVRGGAPTTFSYDSNDRLLSDGSSTFSYDANGNLVARTTGAATMAYGYDAQNRLVTVLGGGLANQYVYDADGNRVLASTASGLARFLVDNANNTGLAQVLEERNGGGGLLARYSYGSELMAMARGAGASFYLRDARSSVRGLADGSGVITDSYVDDAYGYAVATTGSTVNAYRYDGERLDADTGLYQLRARYYNPALGRFMSRDPFGGRSEAPLSRHRYLYAGADPVNHSDPTGLEVDTLAELSLTQAINNTIDVSETFATVRKFCTVKTTLDQVSELLFYTGVGMQLAIASIAVANNVQFGDAYGFKNITFGPSGEIPLIELSRLFVDDGKVERVYLALAGATGRVGVKGSLTIRARPSIDFQLMGPPPEFKAGASVKGAGVQLADFNSCGISLGRIDMEPSIKVYGYDNSQLGEGVGTTASLDLKFQLFAGHFRATMPLMGMDWSGKGMTFYLGGAAMGL